MSMARATRRIGQRLFRHFRVTGDGDAGLLDQAERRANGGLGVAFRSLHGGGALETGIAAVFDGAGSADDARGHRVLNPQDHAGRRANNAGESFARSRCRSRRRRP